MKALQPSNRLFATTYSNYLKRQVLSRVQNRLSSRAIADTLLEAGLSASRQGITRFLWRYRKTGSLERARGSNRPAKVSPAVKQIVETEMHGDDKTTAKLCAILLAKGLSTILCSRLSFDRTLCGSSYCQMIRRANKVKRLQWAETVRA
jgi:transposase